MSGPLPPPAQLAGYETVLPGAAERIMSMAEQQQDHRQGLETKAMDHMAWRSNMGLFTAAGIALAVLAASVVLIATGHDAAGTVLGTFDLVGLTTTFIYGQASGRNERLRRARILAGLPETDE